VLPFAATARSRRRGHWCSSPRLVVTTYAAINNRARIEGAGSAIHHLRARSASPCWLGPRVRREASHAGAAMTTRAHELVVSAEYHRGGGAAATSPSLSAWAGPWRTRCYAWSNSCPAPMGVEPAFPQNPMGVEPAFPQNAVRFPRKAAARGIIEAQPQSVRIPVGHRTLAPSLTSSGGGPRRA